MTHRPISFFRVTTSDLIFSCFYEDCEGEKLILEPHLTRNTSKKVSLDSKQNMHESSKDYYPFKIPVQLHIYISLPSLRES